MGDREPQEFNEDVSQMLQRQERVLGSQKASLQLKEERNGHEVDVEISKSSFLPKEPERRISRGYCKALGP